MRFTNILFSLVIFVTNLFAQNVDTLNKKWSLIECIEYAKQNNLTIKQSELNSELSSTNYTQAKFSFLPNLNGNANYSLNSGKNVDPTSNLFTTQNIQSSSLGLSASMTLFSGFKKINEMRQGYFDYIAAKYSTQQSINDISLAVANAYLQIMFAREQLQRSEQSVIITKDQRDRTEKLFTAGSVAEGNLYELDAIVATDELTRITSQNQYDIALLNLQQLLDLDQPVSIDIPVIELPNGISGTEHNADSIYSIAEKIYPNVISQSFKLQSARKGLAIARSGRFPTLNLFASLSTNYSDAVRRITTIDTTGVLTPIGFLITDQTLVVAPEFKYNFENTPFADQLNDNFGQAVGLRLDIPLFNGWQVNSNVKRNRIQLLSSQYSYDLAKNNLKKDINTAYTDVLAANKKYYATLQQVTSLEKAFYYIDKKFEVGLVTGLDFNTAKKNLNAAASESLQAKYDYLFKLKVLDYYQGKTITLP